MQSDLFCSFGDFMTNFEAAGRSLVASMSLRTNLQQRKLHHQSGNYMQKMRSDNVFFQELCAVEAQSCDLDTAAILGLNWNLNVSEKMMKI